MSLFKRFIFVTVVLLPFLSRADQTLINSFKSGQAFLFTASKCLLGLQDGKCEHGDEKLWVIRGGKQDYTELYELVNDKSPGLLRPQLVKKVANTFGNQLRKGIVLTRPDGYALNLGAFRENRPYAKTNPVVACLALGTHCEALLLPFNRSIDSAFAYDDLLLDALYSGWPIVIEESYSGALRNSGNLDKFLGAFVVQQFNERGQTMLWPVNDPQHTYPYPSGTLKSKQQISLWGMIFNLSGGALRNKCLVGECPPTWYIVGMYMYL